MKILKIFVVLFVTITTLISCEKDDICIDEITPYFIIRFYDADNPEFYKKVVDIKVELEGVDGFYTDDGTTITSFTDSIAIPVKVTEDFTKFNKDDVNKPGSNYGRCNTGNRIQWVRYHRDIARC